jgi:hypothetical protein
MAKKSRGFSDLVRQQQWDKVSKKSFEKLEKNIKSDFGKDVQIVRNLKGIAKMSEVLRDFVSPYADIPQSKKELQNLLGMAVSAWDLSFLSEKERKTALDQIFAQTFNPRNIDAEDIEIGRAMVEEMIDRKLKYFADEHRQVTDFQVEYVGQGDYYLSVASSIPSAMQKKLSK